MANSLLISLRSILDLLFGSLVRGLQNQLRDESEYAEYLNTMLCKAWTDLRIQKEHTAAVCAENERLRAKLTNALKKATDAIELAGHDPLTGLKNRRGAFELYKNFVHDHLRQSQEVVTSLIIFDLDGFKAINDRFGHDRGDSVLQIVSEQLTKVAKRVTDVVARTRLVARYGGDEFVMILVGTNGADAVSRAQAAINGIESVCVGVTASAGVATDCIHRREDVEKHLARLYTRADAALRIAKDSGKNRISIAPPPSL